MKKMQPGGITTVKSTKGVTTKKSIGSGMKPDLTHVGKKGKTIRTLEDGKVVHKGSKGTTEKWNLGGADKIDVKHISKKGETVVFGKPGNTTKMYTSNAKGKTYVKKDGKVTTYKKGGSTKK
jgi:hypothetical protein